MRLILTPLMAAALLCAGCAASGGAQPSAVTEKTPEQWPPDYLQAIDKQIYAALRYPPEAQSKGQEGSVVVKVRMARDGRILETAVLEPSPYDLLNAAAIDAFNRIDRLPAVPDDVSPQDQTFSFNLPVNFRLRQPQVPPPYLGKVNEALANELHYPQAAQLRGDQGSVVVRISMSRDGTIRNIELIKPCQSDALNTEAVDVFRRIGRFPAVPDEIFPEAKTFVFTLPVNFSLR